MSDPKTRDLRVVEGEEPRALMQEYLDARGITEAQAAAAGFEPLDVEATATLSRPEVACNRAAFRIPFFDLDGNVLEFDRLRFLGEPVGFTPTKHDKKPRRFHQEPGSIAPAYLSPLVGRPWRVIAQDTTIDVLLVEGEVKSAAACAAGFVTIAVTGVDNFHVGGDKDRLVPGLDEIRWRGRNVFIVYDSDASTKRDVLRAEAELRAAMERRGAFVRIVRLPPTASGGKQGLDDYLVNESPDEFRKLLARCDRLPDALEDGATLLDTEYPPVEFAIKPYLPKAELVEIHGPHGMFKSTLMLHAALSVATGEPWGGVEAKQGRSVFISLEDRAATLALRARCWIQGGSGLHAKMEGGSKRDPKKLEQLIRKNFRYLGREKASALVLTSTDFGHAVQTHAVVERVVKLCAGADLVIVETAARLHPAGETNEAYAVFAGALETIATKTGACVVVVGHVSKEVARSGSTDSYGLRGGGALADAARSVLAVGRDGDGPLDPVKIEHVKGTHTGRGPDLVWRPEPAPGTVFLRPMTAEERAGALANRVYEKIAASGHDGITLTALTKNLPSKGRAKIQGEIKGVLAQLVQSGRVVADFPKGKRGAPAFHYWAAGLEPASPRPGQISNRAT